MSDKKPAGHAQPGTKAFEDLNEHLIMQGKEVLKRLPAMGPVLMLYMQSGHRRFHFIGDLEWLLMPPLMLKQCKLYIEKEFPIGYVSWAFLSPEVEKRLVQSGGRLSAGDWNSGDNLWMVDIVAPFGNVERILKDVRLNLFPTRKIKLLTPDPETGGNRGRELPPYPSKQKVH